MTSGCFIHDDSVAFDKTVATKKYGIDFAIVSNSDAWEVHHKQILLPEELQVSQEDALERTIQFARKNPGKIETWERYSPSPSIT